MEIKKQAYLAVVGGFFCATVGSLLGGLVVAVMRAIALWPDDLMVASAFLPLAVLYASIVAAPFGFIVGSIGSWWLVGRVTSAAPAKRVYYESAGLGGLLGAMFPLISALGGWGPFKNLLSALPISIGIGITCGIAVAAFMRSYIHRILRAKDLGKKSEPQIAS